MTEEKLTQKWCIVGLLENIKEGYTFHRSDWPLHVTIAGVHNASWDEDMISELAQLLKDISAFSVQTTERDKFGTTEVILVDKSSRLLSLHSLIINFLEKNGAIFNNPEWQKDGYLPHSTVQKHASVAIGEKLRINNIALTDMFPNQDGTMRKITKIFLLQP